MPISSEMLDALWAPEIEPLAQLVEIRATEISEPIRVSDCPDRLLSGRRQGLVSEGEEYPFLPFRLMWSGVTKEQPFGQGKLTIANVDGRIEEAIDAVVEPPEITLRLVRVSDPDQVENAILGASIGQSDFSESEASVVIRPRDFDIEPACAACYTPQRAPGLF